MQRPNKANTDATYARLTAQGSRVLSPRWQAISSPSPKYNTLSSRSMDSFLQLVPMEGDGGADAGLVYSNDDLVAGRVDSAAYAEAHLRGYLSSGSQEAGAFFGSQLCPRAGSATGNHGQRENGSEEMERQCYLQRVDAIERRMREADDEVQQRIDTMKRILELKDPMEQLSEYVALTLEARQEDDVDIVSDLLQCARHLTKEEDSEVALLGAFFFQCDRPRARIRGMMSMLPVVAAMMEASSGLDHSPF